MLSARLMSTFLSFLSYLIYKYLTISFKLLTHCNYQGKFVPQLCKTIPILLRYLVNITPLPEANTATMLGMPSIESNEKPNANCTATVVQTNTLKLVSLQVVKARKCVP